METETLFDKIIMYEQGLLDQQATIEMFQSLVDNGMAWTLQGHYGRTAQALIDDGWIINNGAASHE